MDGFYTAKEILFYFGFTKEYSPEIMQRHWESLLSEADRFSQDLYKSGLTEYVSKFAKKYLIDFSFLKAKEFRKFEEDMLRDFKIPQKAWNLYWLFVDVFKDNIFSYMENNPNFFNKVAQVSLQNRIQRGPGKLKPLSPFNWGISIVTVIGNIVATIDSSSLVMTTAPAYAAISTSSNIVISGVTSGISSSKNEPFLNTLKQRLAKGEITITQYRKLKEAIEQD